MLNRSCLHHQRKKLQQFAVRVWKHSVAAVKGINPDFNLCNATLGIIVPKKHQACVFIPCFLSVSPLQLLDIGIHLDCKGAFTAVAHSVFAQEEKTGLSFPHCLPACLFPSPTESSSCSTPNIVPPSGTCYVNSPSQFPCTINIVDEFR